MGRLTATAMSASLEFGPAAREPPRASTKIDETGLNNVGKLCRVWGTVVYADDANRFFYIDDGSRGSMAPLSPMAQLRPTASEC